MRPRIQRTVIALIYLCLYQSGQYAINGEVAYLVHMVMNANQNGIDENERL